jgi:CxC2 like cysteine cluster associated with KDZ transposases
MREWIPCRNEFLFEILSLEAPPDNLCCGSCGNSQVTFYRCMDCSFTQILCRSCCICSHHSHPFHSIQKWTGQYFVPTTLFELGFILHLGHVGINCAGNAGGGEDVLMDDIQETDTQGGRRRPNLTVVDIGGIYSHQVNWCQCLQDQRHIALLRMGLYPGSTSRPQTAFTFRLLRYFHIDTMECNTSASNFYNKLRHLTNDSNPTSIPVSNEFCQPF